MLHHISCSACTSSGSVCVQWMISARPVDQCPGRACVRGFHPPAPTAAHSRCWRRRSCPPCAATRSTLSRSAMPSLSPHSAWRLRRRGRLRRRSGGWRRCVCMHAQCVRVCVCVSVCFWAMRTPVTNFLVCSTVHARVSNKQDT